MHTQKYMTNKGLNYGSTMDGFFVVVILFGILELFMRSKDVCGKYRITKILWFIVFDRR